MSFKSTLTFFVPSEKEDEFVAKGSAGGSVPPSKIQWLTLVGFKPNPHSNKPNVADACFIADGFEDYPAEKLTMMVSPAHDGDGNLVDGLDDKTIQGRVNSVLSLASKLDGMGSLEDLKADGFSSEDMIDRRCIGVVKGFVAADNNERVLYANVIGILSLDAVDRIGEDVPFEIAPDRGGGSGGSGSGGGRRSRRSRGSDTSEDPSKSEDAGRSDEGGSDDEGSSEDSGGGRRRRSRRSR